LKFITPLPTQTSEKRKYNDSEEENRLAVAKEFKNIWNDCTLALFLLAEYLPEEKLIDTDSEPAEKIDFLIKVVEARQSTHQIFKAIICL
jgi:hypothetical protein